MPPLKYPRCRKESPIKKRANESQPIRSGKCQAEVEGSSRNLCSCLSCPCTQRVSASKPRCCHELPQWRDTLARSYAKVLGRHSARSSLPHQLKSPKPRSQPRHALESKPLRKQPAQKCLSPGAPAPRHLQRLHKAQQPRQMCEARIWSILIAASLRC